MNSGLKRLGLFIALAGSGVAVLWLASEESAPAPRPIVAKSSTRAETSMGLIDSERGTQTQITLQDLTFRRMADVETSPGVFEQRPVTLVRLRNGKPTPDGALMVQEPVLTFLDEVTGAERGTLRALRGKFEAAGSLLGGSGADLTRLQAEAFTLVGDVDGQFPLPDGSHATLSCAELRVDGQRSTAPGLVTWTRDTLSFTGQDMTWDGLTGLLEFERDARLSLPAQADRGSLELTADGGLEWHLPLDESGMGWGELRGPVQGQSSDGAKLSGQRLRLFADASGLELSGNAHVDLIDEAGTTTSLDAESLLMARDGEDGLSLAEARGGLTVRLVSAEGGPDSLLSMDGLEADGDLLVSTSPVQIVRGALELTGSELRWRRADRRLEIPRDARLSVGPAGAADFVGAYLDSPRGLVLWLPDETLGETEPRGQLRGPVRGALPDGTRLEGDTLAWDGPLGQAQFVGAVVIERPDVDGSVLYATAERLELDVDPDGVSGALSLSGDVTAELRRPEAEVVVLTTEQLDLESGRLRVPADLTLRQGTRRLTARGLTADQASRDVVLTGPLHALDEADPQGLLLHANGRLVWTLPEDGDDPLNGRGRLEDIAHLRTADGWDLRAAMLWADGAEQRAELLGAVEANGPAGQFVATEHLVVAGVEGQRIFEAPEAVRFGAPGLSGSGEGLRLDEAAGHVVLQRQIHLERVPTASEAAESVANEDPTLLAAGMTLDASGPLEWFVPPGAQDALAEGHGRFSGDVLIQHDLGHQLLTEELLVDGPDGRFEFVGATHLTARQADGYAQLDADEGFVIRVDPNGELLSLEARGGVRGRAGDVLTGHGLSANRLLIDRLARTIHLVGSARLEQRKAGRVTSLETSESGRLQAVTDAADQPVWVDASGGVELIADDAHGTSDTLTWNVTDDHVILAGDVRFVAMGFGMNAPAVEFWPEQVRWYIPNSVIKLSEADG